MKNGLYLLVVMNEMEDDFLMEAKNYKKGRTRSRRSIILVAACVALFSITANAVGLGLHYYAQMDLGITDVEQVPEYTEYEITSVQESMDESIETGESQTQENGEANWLAGGSVQLVSSFCSGDKLVAYLLVPNVTEEMAAEEGWDFGDVTAEGDLVIGSSYLVEYDQETATALVRIGVGGLAEGTESVGYTLSKIVPTDAEHLGILYDPIEIPVTNSQGIVTMLEQETRAGTVEMGVQIESVSVYAGYVSVQFKTDSMDEFYGAQGTDWAENVGNAVFGEPLTGDETDEAERGDAYFCNVVAITELFSDTTLTMKDGTQLIVEEQEHVYAGDWVCASNLSEGMETGEYEFQYVFNTPLVLDDVESVTILGETYPVAIG